MDYENHISGKPWNTVESWMQLDVLNFTYYPALLFYAQQNIQVKTASVAAASAVTYINIHRVKSKILKYNTTSTNQITFDGEAPGDVERFT
ncbi:unnamed protein product [Schistosoma margrebowiei]|uniref:Uncharacterized protein n=1 Tax=Schistosoma margrebowiei TaxID=48269 RepID=A0A183LPM1_9TREM|nr:unnamed protein product [Schistosoma margrebowiei]